MSDVRLPRISVVVTCYNCRDYIGDAIRSVARQSLRDWECVVVDDCSTDDSASIDDRAPGASGAVWYVPVGLALLGALSESYRAIGSATLILGLYTALAAHGDDTAAPGLPHALLLLAGAAWYGLLSVCWAAWFPNLQVVQNLALLYEALGEYLRLKSRLFEPVRGVDIERRRVGLARESRDRDFVHAAPHIGLRVWQPG